MTWILFDWTGTIAFAISGAMVGLSRRMDIFGIVVLAVLTAVGGGMVRDVLAGITPPVALVQPFDLLLAIATALIVSLVYELVLFTGERRRWFTLLYNVSDTVGLASFTVTGALTGLSQAIGSPYVFPTMLGVITAVGGGIMRDLMAQRVPVVLHMDVYAVASLAGAIVMCYGWPRWGSDVASWVCFALVIALRGLALHYGWQLYHPRPGFRFHHHHPTGQHKRKKL